MSLPENTMCHALEHMTGRGTFEAHVTIMANEIAERERFRRYCETQNLKCVIIELPQGETRSQPMTSTYHCGELGDVTQEVAALASSLRASGFIVSRVKLEAVISNEGVPADDEEAARFPAENYFEFHVKVILPGTADLEHLRAVCKPHGGHLSSNALKRNEMGRQERFITLRVYRVGRARAERAFELLLADLDAAGYPSTNRLREYTLFDSNTQVDAGWLDAPEDEE